MRVDGSLRVPGDKSISHRALMFAALGSGRSRVRGILDSADVRSTAGVLRALGVDVPELADTMDVNGVGLHGLRSPADVLDCGNSGTTTRLTTPAMSRRPMKRIAKPLEAMGAKFDFAHGDGLPMTVHGAPLHGLEWRSETASAQVKSAILLAAVTSGVSATVHEPARSRDHTERMLSARGVGVESDVTTVRVAPAMHLESLDTMVPGDPSSAAFFAGLAALASSGSLVLRDVCVNETRAGFFDVLRTMGVSVEELERSDEGGEPVATLRVTPGDLRAVRVGGNQVPSMIDEVPLLACVAAYADGETVVEGASELRVKESDRIAVVVENLRRIGADAEELADGLRIRGARRRLRGRVTTHGDHRIAMAFGVLGAVEGNEIEIDDPACVAVSYPAFWTDLRRVVRA